MMDAGRELDAEIHRRVIGTPMPQSWYVSKNGGESLAYAGRSRGECERFLLVMPELIAEGYVVGAVDDPPRYSEDIAEAWRAAEKLTGFGSDRFPRGLNVEVDGGVLAQGYTVTFSCRKWDSVTFAADGGTLPLAICRAALAVVDG